MEKMTAYFSSLRLLCRSFHHSTVVKRSAPGLNCPPKLWWVKEISPELHVSGRLTERQLKYVAEGGFKSVVCLNVDAPETFAGVNLPNSSAIASISALTSLQTKFINPRDNGMKSLSEFGNVFKSLDKPCLLTGSDQKSTAFLGLLYLASQNAIKSSDLYRIASSMGYDVTDEASKEIVAKVTGEAVISTPQKPDTENVPVSNYWLAHRIDKNWYTAGQIRRQELPVLESAGFKSIINMRMGVEYDNAPSQEPVTLLNIKDSLATYDSDKKPTRMNPKILEDNRLFPEISPKYVHDSESVNYESTNIDEFGDEIGYNENIERQYIESNSSLKYNHMPLPLPTNTYTREMFEEFRDELMSADKDGPVLLHCRIGRRVAYFGILALAMKEGRSLQWAVRRSVEMGHEVSPEARPDMFSMYQDYLKSE